MWEEDDVLPTPRKSSAGAIKSNANDKISQVTQS